MRKKLKIILISSVIIAVLITLYFFVYNKLSQGAIHQNIIIGLIYSFLVSMSIFIVNLWVIRVVQKKFPWGSTSQSIQRISFEFLATNVNAALVIIVSFFAFTWVLGLPPEADGPQAQYLFQNIIIAMIINTLVTLIIEGIYMFSRWKNALLEAEKLKREKAEFQYHALLNQLNPHFLFNSLNALSSLINTDTAKAKEFISRFSKIYRYVLDVNGQSLVELKQEMNFLESYFYLQEVRYGNRLRLNTAIHAECFQLLVPALSVQLLIENAIKHNEISDEKPLIINIHAENEYLIISNNYQPRQNTESSTGLGLQNLRERYSHLTDMEPLFIVENNHYIAKIPLLKDA